MERFRYGEQEIRWLSGQDPILGRAIERHGRLQREVVPDLFTALARSIVSQQISDRTFRTVWGRIESRLGEVTPETVAAAEPETLRRCGISMRKAGYLQNGARTVLEEGLSAEALAGLSDSEAVDRLVALPGVGVWTAEMLLIFCLQRPDVVSFGDGAIRRGIRRLYGLESLTRKEFEVFRRRWSPYGTVASFYLWAVAHEAGSGEP